jgi:hypothetical protein
VEGRISSAVGVAGREPVTSDLDIYRAANVLVREHGNEAPIHAAMRHDELLEAGDMDGCAVWKRIIAAVKELIAREPSDGSIH